MMFDVALKIPKEQVLQVFQLYEEGATVTSCLSILSISRNAWYDWISGVHRSELRDEHILKYPNGKIAKYRRPIKFHR